MEYIFASGLGSLLAGFGLGYWVGHRGVKGIVSDLEDLRQDIKHLGDRIDALKS